MNYNSWNGKARADKYNQHIAFDEYLDIAKYMVDPNVSFFFTPVLIRANKADISSLEQMDQVRNINYSE